METFVYAEKHNSATLRISALNQEEADEILKEIVKELLNWEFDAKYAEGEE